jgi:lactate permease
MYRLTVASGRFETLQQAIGGVTEDRRLQLLLIAFAFGAFFEGASGFGTPVAVTAAILIGLGFSPLAASGRRSPGLPALPGSTRICWARWSDGSCRSFR